MQYSVMSTLMCTVEPVINGVGVQLVKDSIGSEAPLHSRGEFSRIASRIDKSLHSGLTKECQSLWGYVEYQSVNLVLIG